MSEGAGRNDDRIGGGKKRATRRGQSGGLGFWKRKKNRLLQNTNTPRACFLARLLEPRRGRPRRAPCAGLYTPARRVAQRLDRCPRPGRPRRPPGSARAWRVAPPPATPGKARRPDARGADAHARAPSGDAPRGGRGVRRARGAPVRARARGPRPRHGRGLARAPVARRGDARTTRATLFKTPLQLPLKIREEILYGKIPPRPRASAHAPSLPSSRRTSASSRTPVRRVPRLRLRLAPRGGRLRGGAARQRHHARRAVAAETERRARRRRRARARLAVATARRRASATRSTRQTLAAPPYDDRDYARDALRRAVREESEATGRTPLPRGARVEVANDCGDGAREVDPRTRPPPAEGSPPRRLPAAKRAMTTRGERRGREEVDGLAEAFAAAACIRVEGGDGDEGRSECAGTTRATDMRVVVRRV